jgi:hypothetical protein
VGWRLKPRLRAYGHNVRLRGHPDIVGDVEPAQAGFVAEGPKARRREFIRQWSSIHLEVEHEHDREEAEEDRAADGQRVAGGGPFAQGMS